jgi:hypothetical protein
METWGERLEVGEDSKDGKDGRDSRDGKKVRKVSKDGKVGKDHSLPMNLFFVSVELLAGGGVVF